MIQYIDGNNNSWIIEKDSIEYNPMTALMSSSGIYSGGEHKKIQLSAEQFNEIHKLISLAFEKSEEQETTRKMGTALIKTGTQKCILDSGSEIKRSIENWLKALL